MAEKMFAFVLMPFSQELKDVYELAIKPCADEEGILAQRVDEQSFTETILERIYRQIEEADFIITEMTSQNPNVFYEVGYAHAMNKLCTLVTKEPKNIPFDLKHHRHIIYDGSASDLKARLKTEFQNLKEIVNEQKENNFYITVKELDGILIKHDYVDQAQFDIKIDINNNTIKHTPDIRAIYFHTSGGWSYSANGDDCPSTDSNLQSYSLRHFIRPPVQSLPPEGWFQLKLHGQRTLASKFLGEELHDSYRLSGHVTVEVSTTKGSVFQKLNIDKEIDELPF